MLLKPPTRWLGQLICVLLIVASLLTTQQVSQATITTASAHLALLAEDLGSSQTKDILEKASSFAFDGVSMVQQFQLLAIKDDPADLFSEYMAAMAYLPQAIALPSDEEALDEPWAVNSLLNVDPQVGLIFPNISPASSGQSSDKQAEPTVSRLKFVKPIPNAMISSSFGTRWGHRHTGIDFAALRGTPVVASESGVVVYSGWQKGYGKIVIIDHGFRYRSRYAHCSRLLVKTGQRVSQSQPIANVGSTGHSTGPHLHFEVLYKKRFKNPQPLLDRNIKIVNAR